ncbi:MAG: aminoglycoside phosphotransferase family protein [bacterium]
MLPKLTDDQIKSVFTNVGLGTPNTIKKLSVGFSNDVYSVDDKYIFKAIRNEEDTSYLKKEIHLCNLFKERLPAPVVVHSDTAKAALDRAYVIYEKIQGDNLYMRWHEYSTEERKAIVEQICSYLKVINTEPFKDFTDAFNIDTKTSWHERIATKIQEHKLKALSVNAISSEQAERVDEYVRTSLVALDESVMALTYFDVHFDNFIVRDKKIVGMLDFERTDFYSIDFVLDIVRRMVNEPTKYASEEAEPLIKAEDYASLMEQYKEYYPQLFDFENLEARLKLYSIDHDLDQLHTWPESASLKESLARNTQ